MDAALGLAVVADGMGGHPAGEVASGLAIEAFVEALTPRLPHLSERDSLAELGRAMAEAVVSAERRVRAAVLENPSRRGMGTTLTAVLLPGDDRALVAHVGDSRAYRLRAGGLEMLTRDHTWVWDQVAAGLLTPEDAWGHPRRNLLTRTVGGDEAPAEPDVSEAEIRPGDVLLVCSDGLTGMLRDGDVAELLRRALPQGMEAAASALVDEANRLGGHDNISVALLQVG